MKRIGINMSSKPAKPGFHSDSDSDCVRAVTRRNRHGLLLDGFTPQPPLLSKVEEHRCMQGISVPLVLVTILAVVDNPNKCS
jgi:hypothetical protein